MPPAKSELGYGNAVHHVMRVIAEHARATGKLPTPKAINDLLTSDFFLPFANKAAHKEMRENARKLDLQVRQRAPGRPHADLGDRAPVRAVPRRRRGQRACRRHLRRARRRHRQPRDRRLQDVDGRRHRAAAAAGLRRRRPARGPHRRAPPSSTTWGRRRATTSTSVTTRSQQAEATVIAAADVAEAARLHAQARAQQVRGLRRAVGVRRRRAQVSYRRAMLPAASSCVQNRRCASWPRPTMSGRPGACSALGT